MCVRGGRGGGGGGVDIEKRQSRYVYQRLFARVCFGHRLSCVIGMALATKTESFVPYMYLDGKTGTII